MREILFRGKRTINGDWVEGNLFIPDKHNTPTQILIGTDIYRIPYDIMPQTVGQYTGLTDKNGKKIFEGDIIQSTETKETGVVQWFPEHSAFMVWCKYSDKVGFLYERAKIIEVIGNIHDNPGLMEGALQ